MHNKKNIRLIRDLSSLGVVTPSVVAIGNFDGLHLGHGEILKKVVALAEKTHLTPTVLTFEPLPIQFFNPSLGIYRLTPLAEKIRLLKKWGIEQVICLRFNEALAKLPSADFVEQVLVKGLQIKHLIVGEDFRFGYQRKGNIETLFKMGDQYGFEVQPQPLVNLAQERISSTALREALRRGDCFRAARLLGRFLSVTRRVVKGAERGAQWGFPTANIILPRSQQWLRGVFVTRVNVGERSYSAITNAGIRPTIGAGRHVVESHLLNFNGNLYTKKITVEFLHKLRDEKRFENFNALRTQIEQDKKQAEDFLIELR